MKCFWCRSAGYGDGQGLVVVGARGHVGDTHVGRSQCDHRGDHECDAGAKQSSLEAEPERLGMLGVRREQVVGPDGGEGDEDRQPQRGPELEGRGDQRRCEPGPVGRHAPVGGILNAHHHQAQAGPHDHHPRKDVWQVGAVQGHPGKPEHSGGAQQCPRGDKRPGADLRDPLRCHARSESDAHRQRQIKQASADRRVAEHFLHVERDEEEHRVEGGPPENLGDIGLPQALDLEQRQGHERVAVALLVEQEQDDQRNAAGELPEGPGCAPAGIGGIHQDVDQKKHAARDEAGADRVKVP